MFPDKLKFFEAHAYVRANDLSTALSVAEEYANQHVDNPYAGLLATEIAYYDNDFQKANVYFQRAVNNLPVDVDLNTLDMLSSLGHQLEQYNQVVALLNRDCFKKAISPFSIRLMDSLMRMGRNEEAEEIAFPLWDPADPDPLVGSIILSHHERLHHFNHAISVADTMISNRENDPYFVAKKIALQIKKDDNTDANKTFEDAIEKFNTTQIFQILYDVASLGNHQCRRLAKSWAVSFRLLHLTDLEALKGFVSMAQSLQSAGFGESVHLSVTAGCGVKLESEDHEFTVILSSQCGNQDAVAPDSEVGQLIIGMQLHEVVFTNGKKYRISEIYSPFNAAFLDSVHRIIQHNSN